MSENSNFGKLVLDSLKANSGKVMLQDQLKEYTGADLIRAIEQNLLKLQSVKHREALVLIPFGKEHLCWVLACMLQGIAVSYIPRKRLFRELLFGKRRIIIWNADGGIWRKALIRFIGHAIPGTPSGSLLTNEFFDRNPGQPALISHSSGTSGTPKVICRQHQTLIAQHLALKAVFPAYPEQIDFPLFPNVVLHQMASGVQTSIPILNWKEWFNFNPQSILQQIRDQQVTSMTGNVHYFKRLVDWCNTEPTETLTSVREVGVGGSPVPERLLTDLSRLFPEARVYCIYGSTEAEPIAVREYVESRNVSAGYCVGKPHPSLEVEITPLSTASAHTSDLNIGEIKVRGDHVVSGKNGWLETGDIAFRKQDELFLVARKENAERIQEYFAYQLEHYLIDTLNHMDLAVIPKNDRAHVFYSSSIEMESSIRTALKKLLGDTPISVYAIPQIPKDDRHHSKTLYQQLHADYLS